MEIMLMVFSSCQCGPNFCRNQAIDGFTSGDSIVNQALRVPESTRGNGTA